MLMRFQQEQEQVESHNLELAKQIQVRKHTLIIVSV